MKHPHLPRSATHGVTGAHLLVLAAALLLCGVPLFDSLGFEFAAAIGWLVAYVSGWRAAGCAVRSREEFAGLPAAGNISCATAPLSIATSGPPAFPGTVLLRCALENLSLLGPPLAVMAIRGLWVPSCNWQQGVRFYALFPIPAVLYGTAIGFALGLALAAGRARLAFIGWSLLTYAFALWPLLVEPPKFVFNAFVGYFPGPIYDSEVAITPALVVARGIVVAQALFVLCGAALAWNGRRLGWRGLTRRLAGERAVLAVMTLVLGAALALAWAFAAPLGVSIDRAFIQRELGGVMETAHFHLYYDRTALSESRARALAQQHECRYAQLARFFGAEPPRKIGSYVYGSAAQKKRLMGAAGTSFEDAWNDEFHINASSEDPHPTLTHEMAHIFAAHLVPRVPVCWKIGIHEGIAVAAEWDEESAQLELTPDEACVAMDSLGLLPDLERSLSAFGFWTQPGARVYTACGSFVHYLLADGGMERFRVLWRRGDFAAAYGKRLPELLAEWRAALGAVPITPGGLRRAERLYRASGIFQQPCAHELARLEVRAAMAAAAGDFGEAERLETRLAELDPENPERRLALAGIRLRRQDWSGARMAARAMLAENRAGPAAQERAWRLMGDVAWRLNDLSAADSSYAHAVALAGSSADRRAYEVRRATLRDPHLALLLRDYLTGPGGEPSQDLATIYRARAAAPESALPHYLLGRRLVQEGLPEDGAPELRSALDAGGLGPEATVAALELLGRAELAAGRPRAALEALDRLLAPSQDEVRLGPGLSPPTVPLSHGRALGIADWISRARWALGQASAAYDSTAGASGNR